MEHQDDEPPRPAGQAPAGARRSSPRARLFRAGFADTDRAASLLTDPDLRALLGQRPGPGDPVQALITDLSQCADPDLGLLTLVRLAQACRQETPHGPRPAALLASLMATATDRAAQAAQDSPHAGADLQANDGDDPGARAQHWRRLLAVIGYSQALGDFLVSHPWRITALSPANAWEASGRGEAHRMLIQAARQALEAPEDQEPAAPTVTEARNGAEPRIARATAALRCAYRDRLAAVVADDLLSGDPVEHMATVGERMTRLADAALEAALLIARAAVGPRAQEVELAIIAMGKTGAGELNYISDIDVVYVVAPTDPQAGLTEERIVATGTLIATELARITSATGPEPALWPLDTALRPEGKDGALVRTLESHLSYYQRWAESWEFQALLKARPAAGSAELGAAYSQAITPLVWQASSRENFVEDARAMRQRVERASERAGTDRRIKLGPGGLRDVEFTVQLLQLVHGRGDPALRAPATLEALRALSDGGYVSRQDAAALADCYKALRVLEHRAQLHRLRRTHELPSRPEDLRRIGRSLHRSLADAPSLWTVFRELRRRVRALHEEIYYRPLLGAAASLSADEMALSPQAARERLQAVGYLDAEGALRHIQALTEGVSRRAAIQRQLLPVIIGWIGQGADPDAGLLSFRKLSETIGGSHWYLAMLRDSPVAAQRLCQVLSGSHWATERLTEFPESIAWLDDDAELAPRTPEALAEEIASVLRRRPLDATEATALEAQALEAVQAVVRVRAREEVRALLADCLDGIDPRRTAAILTSATDAVLAGALSVATALVAAQRSGQDPDGHPAQDPQDPQGPLARHAIIAMGRLGGAETSYASDADVLFVHEPAPGVEEGRAAGEAEAVARTTVRLLAAARPHPLEVDADLRPEGRQGAMSRSLQAYADYYGRWAQVWERQALLRARACAGDPGLGRRFEALINPLRWAPQGLSRDELREIRRIKARVETERLPRGIAPARHLKLGPGGLSDVEWSAQILQLRHAGQHEGLRTTSTLETLRAAVSAGLLSAEEGGALAAAWVMASRLRAAIVLGTARTSAPRNQVLPDAIREIRLVGRLIGLSAGRERELEDLYRRSARHARSAAEHLIFGAEAADADASGEEDEALAVPAREPISRAALRDEEAVPQARSRRSAAGRRSAVPGRPGPDSDRGSRPAADAGERPDEAGSSGEARGQQRHSAGSPGGTGAPGGQARRPAPGGARRGGAARPRRRREGPYPWS
ncbi:bifunctional [glutamine synthetase] adenylyltransferase/[glutamine synthetase]-adenylyl-L-tyrosine phosphorylase [Actinomyces slackii]|uniref:bifunctional [glutamine synthetase] adenylyltransferase/[glutamine synthetase]-adenylyl-L-tyrosine phosphorylase n=1 Tax=Actinomyces slackii TaxID=52774 RepID=UPI00047E66F7|nr:bifunctional [glutamine synthetase] adenylyltransferase/[glutamine synthetase]-adenylyl-L-tyrosine phosphorylase [Actinomyces slackii]